MFSKDQSPWGGAGGVPGTRIADPKRKIIVMIGLLLVLFALVGVIRAKAADPKAQRASADAPSQEIVISRKSYPMPTLDREYVKSIRDETKEERQRWEENAISYLVTAAQNTPAVLQYNRNLLPLDADSAAGVRENPDAWRFQFVRFRGRIEWIEEVDYADRFGGDESIGLVHVGRLLVAPETTAPDGTKRPAVRISFVTPIAPQYRDENDPALNVEHKPITDGWVRGRGIFVKRYLDLGPDRAEHPALQIVAVRLRRDYEVKPVTSRADIPFNILRDQPELLEDEDTARLLLRPFPKALMRLVRYASPRFGEKGKELRAKDLQEHGIKPRTLDDAKTYEAVVNAPDQYRMHYFTGRGAMAFDTLLVGPEEVSANDAGIESYVTGWIATDHHLLFQFAAPVEVARAFKKRARVRFGGYFYKTQAYHARNGTDRMAPFLVLTELREMKVTKVDPTSQIAMTLSLVAGVALLIFLITREDKTKRNYRRELLERRRERAAAEGS